MRRALHKRNTANEKFVTEILSGDFLLSSFGNFNDDDDDVSDEQQRETEHRKKRNQK
jgi:hypothetical protein